MLDSPSTPLETFPPTPLTPKPPPLEPAPSPGKASRVYLLLVFLLIATSILAALLPDWRWLFLLGGDPLLLLAVLWAVRREKRAPRPALRWNWPGWPQVGLGLLLGLGAYAAGAIIQIVVTLIFGQVAGVDIRRFATDPLMLAVFVISAVVLAPLCEEVIFRGYFLGIYERYLGPGGSLVVVALLFAVLHLQLFGIFSLLPAAFLLTYLALRSGSLAAGIAAHFAFNLTGTTLGLVGLSTSPLVAGLLACCLLALGPVVGIVALAGFRRVTLPSAVLPRLVDSAPWLGRYWPLVIAGLVYLVFAGLELVNDRFPQLLAGPRPALRAPVYQLPASFTYQAQELVPFEPPAEITCGLQAQSPALVLDCQRRQPKTLLTPETTLHWTVTWQTEPLELISASYTSAGRSSWSAEISGQADGSYTYVLKPSNGVESTFSLPAGALVDGSWPWQLSGLPFARLSGRGGRVQVVTLNANGIPQVQETAVQNQGLEKLTVPAGPFQTWSLKVGREAASYNLQSPHLPVEFTWGGETYQLKTVVNP